MEISGQITSTVRLFQQPARVLNSGDSASQGHGSGSALRSAHAHLNWAPCIRTAAMKSVLTTHGKSASNRRNAQLSTGPKTAVGKSIARLNATKHGLNTPVPDYMVRASADQYRELVDHIGVSPVPHDGGDLVYALAAHARLRAHRAEVMRSIVEASRSDDSSADDALRLALTQLGRLHSYERKSASRLGGLLKGR